MKAKFKIGQVIWHRNAQKYMRLARRGGTCMNLNCHQQCWYVSGVIPKIATALCESKFNLLTKRERGA